MPMARTITKIIRVTPVVETNAYANSDQIGVLTAIPDAVSDSGGAGILTACSAIDASDVSPAFDVLLFSGAPTVASADNATLNIVDAQMAANFIGRIVFPAAGFIDLGVNRVSTLTNLGLIVKAGAGSTSLYFLCIARAAITFAAADALTLVFSIIQD